MTKFIALSDELHEKLRKEKGSLSYAKLIEKLLDNKEEFNLNINLVSKLDDLVERVDKLEKFVNAHSGY